VKERDVIATETEDDETLVLTVRVSDDRELDTDAITTLVEQGIRDEYGDDESFGVVVVLKGQPMHREDSDAWIYAVAIGGSLIALLCGCLLTMMWIVQRKSASVQTQSQIAMDFHAKNVDPGNERVKNVDTHYIYDDEEEDAQEPGHRVENPDVCEVQEVSPGQQTSDFIVSTAGEDQADEQQLGMVDAASNVHTRGCEDDDESFEVQSEDDNVSDIEIGATTDGQ